MTNAYRTGTMTFPETDEPVDFNCEVSYAGVWRSINDYGHYRVATEGFGNTSQTFRRTELQSNFYAGSYSVNNVPDNTKRPLTVWVRGASFEELSNARDKLIDWFTQDEFIIRIVRDETMEYWQAECADYQIDESHVFMHNRMCKVTFTTSVAPYVNTYVVF